MSFKKFILAAAVAGAFGLSACSEGDKSSLVIEGDNVTNNNGGDGGDGGDTTVSSCPEWASARTKDGDTDVCQLPATIASNLTLTADTIWFMDGRVTVGNGNRQMSATAGTLSNGSAVQNVTLTIEPGTQIKGKTGSFANLLITRGSKLMAEGTAGKPIVFSSDDDDLSGAGEWGGVIIHGYGPHNVCGTDPSVACNIDSEGESGFAGGYDSDDDSGVLKYVVITEGGYEFAVGNEINGLSMMSVGAGTTIDYLQINANADDGVEFYGGTVNARHVVLSNNLDDSVDWDEGYSGNLQYVIVKQSTADGTAVEADTDGSASGFLSKPTVANFTFLADSKDAGLGALNLKARTGGFFHNGVITIAGGANPACVTVAGSGAQANRNVAIYFDNVIADCPAFGDDVLEQTSVFAVDAALNANYTSQAAEAMLAAPYDWAAFKAAHGESVADTDFLDATNYLGAVKPDGSDLWYEGWTLEGSL